MKLNITGLEEEAQLIKDTTTPGPDGTFAHIGAKGGTEMIAETLRTRLDPKILQEFNIIHSRVRKENLSEDKPNILVLHDTWDDPESQHLKDPKSLDRFRKLVFVSNFQQATYNMGLGVPYAKGTVMQNAITPIDFTLEDKETSKIRLIYHTTPHRGLEILVPVFEALYKDLPNIHLDVFSSFEMYGWVGRDEPYKELFKKIEDHPGMTYHGYQQNVVVREYLRHAHIFAYPNIWPETSCISAIEAMSAGCEIVCPNFYALPETTLGFATMYGFNENPNEHANLFAGVLKNVILNYDLDYGKGKREIQKIVSDNYFNWDFRLNNWSQFLNSMIPK